MTATSSGAELVGRTLAELGVTRAFGVVGSGNYVVTDALVRGGARYVAARHEAGATGMADGFFRATGEPAVCSVHQGPGLTNTITALTEAAKSRVPMVVVAGATSAGMTRSNFFIDQQALVRSTGAIAESLHRSETVVEDTVRAFDRAITEQRPVVLNMPLDVQAAAASAVPGTGSPAARRAAAAPTDEVVEQVVAELLRARRPVIVAGRGAWRSGARGALQELADATGAMLATTAVAKGLFAGHPRDLGVSGGFSSDSTARTLAAADLVIGFGCSFTHWTTRSNQLFSDRTTVIQVDTDVDSLALNRRVDLGLVGDAAATARLLLQRVASAPAGSSEWRLDPPPLGPATEPTADQYVSTTERGYIHPAQLTAALEKVLPAERTVVMDGGHFIGWPATGWSVPDPAGFLFSSAGFQSIGLGMGLAAGAAVGRPDRLPVLAVGDGGFLMSVAELETLTREKLPVLVVVYDDAAYGAEVHHFAGHGSGLELVRFPPSDIAAVARGFGAQAVTVREVGELDAVERWLADRNGPLVVDAKIAPDVVGYWAAQDFVGH